MGNDVEKKISDYLSSHLYLNLATVSPDGKPLAHTVGFANDGAIVYFVTDKKTRKANNINGNPNVAFTCDEDYTDLYSIQGVQMKGKAELETNGVVIEKIMGTMLQKFPQMKDMPENPDYVFFKITPLEGVFIDNTRGFGHREEITF
jgi:general stress protein 26